ncbi:MAG: hypothetical protein L0Y60_07615 [Beijerinckiaceae bacterium]|nr:hypothetical protein [Beijerinckiaceae bacterium]
MTGAACLRSMIDCSIAARDPGELQYFAAADQPSLGEQLDQAGEDFERRARRGQALSHFRLSSSGAPVASLPAACSRAVVVTPAKPWPRDLLFRAAISLLVLLVLPLHPSLKAWSGWHEYPQSRDK